MRNFGEILTSTRNSKKISLKKAAHLLLIKKEHLEALESENWQNLPEASFVKGYIISYSQLLGLEPEKMLALFRREYDEKKYLQKTGNKKILKSLFLTPKRVRNSIFFLAIVAFIAYILIQFLQVLSSPKLELLEPQDDISVSIPLIQISGRSDPGAIVSVGGEFVPIDENGNFSYQYKLEEGKNIIEIIASKRLSPKSKVVRTVRLVK